MQQIKILSPKRNKRIQKGWEAFFPYYAGYPEVFVDAILESAALKPGSVVMDPWNGSGTTTLSAARRGYRSIGYDINPVMVVVARARLLPHSEADSLEPLLQRILDDACGVEKNLNDDPLGNWFDHETVFTIRGIENSIRRCLVGQLTLTASGVEIGKMSSLASVFYVALFAVCRKLAMPFRSSNPTWTKVAKDKLDLIKIDEKTVFDQLRSQIKAMTLELGKTSNVQKDDLISAELAVMDSRLCSVKTDSVDCVVTSPPYCTRIDYTSATRIELAILSPLCSVDYKELSRQMIGSTRVPIEKIEIKQKWGQVCNTFLKDVAGHPSKASNGYYLKTHLDYFEKMSLSLMSIRSVLKRQGMAIFVVQDSYYKNIHNDLPTIITEMSVSANLSLRRREDFEVRQSMSGINSSSKIYMPKQSPVESVLCFEAV